MLNGNEKDLEALGFSIVSDEDGMNVVEASAGCSGSRSDCCTRVCSADANFTDSAEAWEQYLAVKGGQVQY